MTMNPSAKAEVQRILDAGPDSCTDEERAFLTARRGYLTAEQRINFGISEPEAASSEEATDEESAPAKPARRSRTS